MADENRRFTDAEIEEAIDRIARWDGPAVQDDAAAMLRQLLAERRAIAEIVDSPERFETIHHMGDAIEDHLRGITKMVHPDAAELADLRAYRQRREAEDKADHIGDANKMVPAAVERARREMEAPRP